MASILDGLDERRPALERAAEIGRRAATVGFEFASAADAWSKVVEEMGELRAEAGHPGEELGDLLFSIVNYARWLGVDPEAALEATNAKFIQRFRFVEDRLAAEGRTTAGASLDEMDRLWEAAKAHRGTRT